MTRKSYRPWLPGQPVLFTPDVRRWLPEDHLVWFVLDLVEQLDLSRIDEVIQAKDPRGTQPYDPRMMVALLLYAYSVGVYSSRRIERATYEDVAFRVLTADQQPDHDTIAAFRRDHLEEFKAMFLVVVRLAAKMGLVKFGLLGLDGTKIKANASKHKAMSYDRMKSEIERLEKEIAELLAKAEATDADEDARYGDGSQVDIPAELARRRSRLARIRNAKEALEAEARQARISELKGQQAYNEAKANDPTVDPKERKASATRARQRAEAAQALRTDEGSDDEGSDDDPPDAPPPSDGDLPNHQVKHHTDGTPQDKAQRNFTDPDSRIMVDDGEHYVQAYNAHIVVDAESQIIVAQGVGNQPPDTEYLPGMVNRAKASADAADLDLPDDSKLVADAGFWSPGNVVAAKAVGLDPHIAIERTAHGVSPPLPDQPPDPANPRELMRHKLATKEGKLAYSRRKVLPEPVFGQIKSARSFRSFSLRGLDKVRGEWALVTLTHDILKLWRSGVPLPAEA